MTLPNSILFYFVYRRRFILSDYIISRLSVSIYRFSKIKMNKKKLFLQVDLMLFKSLEKYLINRTVVHEDKILHILWLYTHQPGIHSEMFFYRIVQHISFLHCHIRKRYFLLQVCRALQISVFDIRLNTMIQIAFLIVNAGNVYDTSAKH